MRAFAFAALALFSTEAFSAQVIQGSYNASTKSIDLTVRYPGGCGTHEFSLRRVVGCRETLPVQCSTRLIEKADDPCEALVTKDISIPLAETNLNDRYFSRASLTITGDGGTSVTVRLPQF